VIPSYRPAAPLTGGTVVDTNPTGSNRGGTARPERPIPMAVGPAGSPTVVNTDCDMVVADHAPIYTGYRWKTL
jgi:hypothetical protein